MCTTITEDVEIPVLTSSTLFKEKPCIIKVKDILIKKGLQIPEYQRPYKWTVKNVNQLIDDILFFKDKAAYRIGTVVLHKHNNEKGQNVLDIVDGQQRSITLSLIAWAIITYYGEALVNINLKKLLDNFRPTLLDCTFASDISKYNIQNNFKAIKRRISDFDEKSIKFFFNQCELVQVTLIDITEAFQFFDSQNARGKDLVPHDLLKAFHLREMASVTQEETLNCVSSWESIDQEELALLFENYLFRIRNWSKGQSARYFTKNDVDLFKGISMGITTNYPFAQLFRIAHFYTNQYNSDPQRSFDLQKTDYPFQLDQFIINGKRFFEMIDHYKKLKDILKEYSKDHEILNVLDRYVGMYRAGDKHVRILFTCCLLYYVDKFGTCELTKASEKFFIWAYSLRLMLKRVEVASIDKYALGNHEIINRNITPFTCIREAMHPAQVLNLKLQNVPDNRSNSSQDLINLFKKFHYYDK